MRSRGQLDREGHNVTVIDSNQAVLDKTSNLLDVVGIYGNGATPQTLKEAGADHADLVIAATSKDEINILSCLLAKKMGARHTIARIRTPEYVDSLNYVKEELGFLWISIRNCGGTGDPSFAAHYFGNSYELACQGASGTG